MKEEIPKCNSCGQPMFEIAELAGDIQIISPKTLVVKNADGTTTFIPQSEVTGMRHPKLYQCPECKDVKIY